MSIEHLEKMMMIKQSTILMPAAEAKKFTRGFVSTQDFLRAINRCIVEASQVRQQSGVVYQEGGFQNLRYSFRFSGFSNDKEAIWADMCPAHKEVVQRLQEAGYAVHPCITNSLLGTTGLHISWAE